MPKTTIKIHDTKIHYTNTNEKFLLWTVPTRTINQPQTSVTINNSPQDYTNPDDQPTINIDSPG